MLNALVAPLLRARRHAAVLRAERILRSAVPPLDRVAKRAYAGYKRQRLIEACGDPELRGRFLGRGPLPPGYGEEMDERIVEYPWVLSRLAGGAGTLLDAGSTLNFDWIADDARIRDKRVIVCTLAPEGVLGRAAYSYLYGDLRDLLLRDACVDAVVCISTLEHVGMDNRGYTGRVSDAERRPESFTDAVAELARVLKPGGPLLLTVPYGRPQDLGWLRQFDAARLEAAVDAFAGEAAEIDYFRHGDGGWQRATAAACADAEFLWLHGARGRATATRASAVACLRLVRGAS